MTTTATPPGHGFGLTVSPASVHLFGATASHYSGHVTVENPGSQPLHIAVSEVGLTPTGPKCTLPTRAPAWLTMHGSKAFTLQPGQEHVVGYTVNAPAGTVDSAAIVTAATPAVHGAAAAARLNVSAGSRISLNSAARCHAAPITLPVQHASAASHLGLYVLLAVIAVLAGLAVVVVRRRRHRQNYIA